MISAKKNFFVHFLSRNQDELSLVANTTGAWIEFFILESHVMLRHKMDTKQQGEHIEH